MRKDRIALWLLESVTTRERAASTVGDLRETGATRGELWFWWSVLRTATSLLWRGLVADRRTMLGLALRGSLMSLGLAVAFGMCGALVAAVIGFVHASLASRNAAGLGAVSGGFPTVGVTWFSRGAMALSQFPMGRWIARRAPGRELSACLALAILLGALAGSLALMLAVITGTRVAMDASFLLVEFFCFLGAWSVRRRATR